MEKDEWTKLGVKKNGIRKFYSYTKESLKKNLKDVKKESKYNSTKILTNFVPKIGPKKSFCKPSLFVLNPDENNLKKYSEKPVKKNLLIVSSSESEESEDNSSNLGSSEENKIKIEDKKKIELSDNEQKEESKNDENINNNNPEKDNLDFKSNFNFELKPNVENNGNGELNNNNCIVNKNDNGNENNNYLSILDVLAMTKK